MQRSFKMLLQVCYPEGRDSVRAGLKPLIQACAANHIHEHWTQLHPLPANEHIPGRCIPAWEPLAVPGLLLDCTLLTPIKSE